MTSYGFFCPVAKAMEVLDERWTLLIVRDMFDGSTRFGDFRKSMPKLSPSLLSKRLESLERAGIILRREQGGRTSYHLTRMGEDLLPVCLALRDWSERWIGELGTEDCDPHQLFFHLSRNLELESWPRIRTAVAFTLTDVAPKVSRWWLVVDGDHVDMCDFDPGYEVAATVTAGLVDLTRVWRADVDWFEAVRRGIVAVTGPAEVQRALPRWLRISQRGERRAANRTERIAS